MTHRMTDSTYEMNSWSLDELFPSKSGPELEQAFATLEATAAAIEAKRSLLAPEIDEETFVEILELIEKLAHWTQKLDGYSILLFFADTGDEDALALRGRVDRIMADTKNQTLFFDLWWKELDAANARRLLAGAGDIATYLETLRSFAPYTLSEAEERIINLKNTSGAEGLMTLYTMMTNGFRYSVEIEGETETLGRGGIMGCVQDASPATRESAYRSFLNVFAARSGELAQIYRCIATHWHDENINLRGFATPISFRNLENNLSDEVVSTLLETCRENASLYQRYFKLKAKWLGLPKLKRFDIFAPIEEVEAEVPFTEAVDLVLDTFHDFSPALAEQAERVLSEGHVDSISRAGKRGGALSWDALPGMTPWILLNYGGRPADVATLAHELGHAVHAMMASDHSVLTFSPPLPMAETASSFTQMLSMEKMLERDTDPKFRRSLLAQYIDSSYLAIPRQAFTVRFEQQAHQMIANGASVEQLCEAYMGNLREQFGDSVGIDDIFQYEWLTASHLFTLPFYDYAYAFGLLIVLGLYQRYKEEGEAFVPKYLKILAYGGAKAPVEILDEVGFDVRKRDFWQGGFDVLAGMVDELESLS